MTAPWRDEYRITLDDTNEMELTLHYIVRGVPYSPEDHPDKPVSIGTEWDMTPTLRRGVVRHRYRDREMPGLSLTPLQVECILSREHLDRIAALVIERAEVAR